MDSFKSPVDVESDGRVGAPSNIAYHFHVADEGDEVNADKQVIQLLPSTARLASSVASRLHDAQPQTLKDSLVPFVRFHVYVRGDYE